MLNRQHRKARILFGLSDVVLTALALEAAYQTRLLLPLERVFFLTPPVKALVLGFVVLAWVRIGSWLEIYDRLDAGSPGVILRDTLRQCGYGAAALVVFEYLLRLDLSRAFLGLLVMYAWLFLCLFRFTAGRLVGLVRREYGAEHFVAIVGDDERAHRLGAEMERSAHLGIRLVGYVPPARAAAELEALLRRQVVDEIVFTVGSEKLAELEDVFLLCDEEGVRTRVAVDFFPHVNSTVSLARLGETPLLTFTAAPQDEARLLAKRALDIALAAAGMVVLAPFMLLVAALIRATSPGPAIFSQMRCGLNGRLFRFYKFRSMCAGAEAMRPALEHLSHRETAFKLADDPRLTHLGRYLRKFSIDEWPQLWNVLRGDMSLVGPRPAVPREVERYKQWQRRRLRMRPGLTCLWALNGRDAIDFETWMRLDMEYIDNWSLGLDCKILLRTIPKVISGRGAS
ncbi:MAG: sugar transferase [Bryobacteraceae bacterium]